jgi:acyl-coenzyme A thioesterase PaaI-like protein
MAGRESQERLETLTDAMREEMAARWNAHPGVQRMGVKLEIVSREELRGIVDPITPFQRGGMGTPAVNGPTMAAIFDLVTGFTGYLQTPGLRVGVAELNVRFLRPVLGERFEVVGRPDRTGRSLVFVACELLDETGTVCAKSDGLVAVSQSEGTDVLALQG